jgi:predicted protein tyrosine phosphatase
MGTSLTARKGYKKPRKMKILFICSANIDRSPTAAKTIHESYPNIETKSAGTSQDAYIRVNENQIQWADAVYGELSQDMVPENI